MRIRIQDLIKQLKDNKFVLVRTKGDHRIYKYYDAADHHTIAEATIAGHDTEKAPHYLIREVQDAIEAAGGTWED